MSNILNPSSILPSEVNYSAVKPMGFPSSIKQLVVQPNSQLTQIIAQSDNITFQINNEGYWDPYTAQLVIEVDFYPQGQSQKSILQLDGSAHSLIEEMVISCKGTELERITQYDQIAQYLMDMQYGSETKPSRLHEGVGYGSFRNIPLPQIEGEYFISTGATSVGKSSLYSVAHMDRFYSTLIDSTDALDKQNGGLAKNTPLMQTILYATMGMPEKQILGNDVDPRLALSTANLLVPYERIDQKIIHCDYTLSPALMSRTPRDHLQNSNFDGALSSSFTNSCWEPRYSNQIQQSVVMDGLIDNHMCMRSASYRVPLLSGLLGALMPPESYRFVPMKTLQNLTIDFRLNKYAFFASGLDDGQGIYSPIGMALANHPLFMALPFANTQETGTWKITKFELHVDIIEFDLTMRQILNQSLRDGIYLHTTSWYMGYFQTQANTQQSKGSFQVNVGLESLKTIAIVFNSNDYLSKNFCRKKYRLSRNVKSLRAKIGLESYPQFGLYGHGGNSVKGSIANDTNLPFLIETYKCFGKLHSTATNCFINQSNFAVNMRPYNPQYSPAINNQNAAYLQQNAATGVITMAQDNMQNFKAGWPLFYENQVVGKALYCINCESMTNSTYISGVNTITSRPFTIDIDVWNNQTYAQATQTGLPGDLNFHVEGNVDANEKNHAQVYNDNPCTMYIFLYHDLLYKLSIGQIEVIGRS